MKPLILKKGYLLYIILLLAFYFANAQKEASHWYFGINAGLNFNSGVPVADFDGALVTIEGCASISDVFGNLLFYTDGSTVWNRNHDVMPTGDNSLAGDVSSTQSAIIVPKPGDLLTYFIFTADGPKEDPKDRRGLNYYTVDMSLDGGLGDVVGLNDLPIRNGLLTSPTSEKIAAVKVFDEDAYWVMSLKEDRFYVFKVESTGVAPIPENGNDGFSVSADLRGYLKTSPDGTRLVSVNMQSGTYLYDFDSATGTVSNEMKLDLLELFGYGAEFSPSGAKLYISTGNYVPNDPQQENLFQFTLDMPNPNIAKINASRIKLHSYLNSRSALQLGLDGKIYRAIENNTFLGVINDPEGNGLDANYNHYGFNLGSGISGQGLPPFIQSFFDAQIQVDNLCFGDETEFKIISKTPIITISWDFGDGTPPSTEENPTHVYAASEDYDIRVEVLTAEELDIIEQTISIYDFPDLNSPVNLQQCDDGTDGISLFNLTESEILVSNDTGIQLFTYFLTPEDAENNENPIENVLDFSNNTASRVYVRVENQARCHSIAQVDLVVSTTAIPADFMVDLSECDNDLVDGDDTNGITNFDFSDATQEILDLFPPDQDLLVSYYENMSDALAKQNTIDSENYRNENSPFSQNIIVRVDSRINNACIGLGNHLTLTVKPLPTFELIELDYLCLNQLPSPLIVQVTNPQGLYTYEWRDANGVLLTTNTTSIYNVTEAGDYYVTAINDLNCEQSKKITVVASNLATVTDVDIIDGTANNSIDVHVSGEGDYEFALNDINGIYQEDGYFELSFGGLHTVYIRDINGCGIIPHEVVIIDVPKFFTPNGDGINDYWQVSGAYTQPNSIIYIFDRFGKVINQIDASGMGWDGNYNGNEILSSDYWYMVQLEDGRVLKGHFSLIRR